MTEDPTIYKYRSRELATLVLVAFMLVAKDSTTFTNKNYMVNAARLIIRAKAYMLENSPDAVDKFYRELQIVLNGVIA